MARAQSLPEVVAVAAAILYLVLAIREHIACWFFAALSTVNLHLAVILTRNSIWSRF